MTHRRAFIVWGCVSLVAPLTSDAQTILRRYQIGLLLITSRAHPGADRLLQPFLQGMREMGYTEGRDLIIHWAEGDGHPERLPALAAQLVAKKVDLIVAGGHEAAVAAKSASSAIPIVFVSARDPVGQGLVKSLPRPGGNVTGFTADPLGGKWLELLREVSPPSKRLAIIHVRDDALFVSQVREFAPLLRFELFPHELSSEADLEHVLRTVEAEQADSLLVLGGVITYKHRQRILDFAATRRLPAIYPLARWADDGGLLSYGVNYADNWRRAVAYTDRILKGAKPADLPVQLPTRLELVINAKTAADLRLTIPLSVSLRADRVIKE